MRGGRFWSPHSFLPPQNPYNPSTLSNVVYFSGEVEDEFVFLMFVSRMLVSEAIHAVWELSKLRSELGSLFDGRRFRITGAS